jgi:hypothetical protein
VHDAATPSEREHTMRALLSLSHPDPEGTSEGTVALTHEELALWIN